MNSLTVKIIAALLGVLMVTMLGSQLYYFINEKHDTEEAVLSTINENISFDGVVVRNETVINYSSSGVIDYLYEDGSKVKADDAVAEVYDSEEQILAKRKAQQLDAELAKLDKAQNPGTTNFVQPEVLKNRIDGEYKQMLSRIAKGDYTQLGEDKSDLLMSMNIYDVVTKSESDYNSRVAALTSERNKQSASSAGVKDTIKATKTGYFVSSADGYENQLSIDKIDSITVQQINDIVKSTPQKPANAVGKIYDGYSCKIVGVMDADKRVIEGVYLKLAMSASKNTYDVYVDSVKNCDDGKILVVMSCDKLDEELASTRIASSMIVFDEFTGIRVPRKAIRFNGEQKGVYVILGKDITFKKIDVIYEGDDFVLSKNTDDQRYLLLYDQILLENVRAEDVSSVPDDKESSNSKGEEKKDESS
ncbi:MAG: hypothetical protein IJ172_08955 [Ruminococcus sp.]|nr:hypothetical protein [Ruminococcus sp.]